MQDIEQARTMNQRNGSMDILRSLAIIVVINCHVASTFDTDLYRSVLGLGGRGVDLFFALSGWLLGHQLLRELSATGTIEIRRFWLRRWLRTLPAYYVVLLFTYLWQVALKDNWHLDWTFLFFGQTYLSDMPYFGVSWSLCVEEHFYLLIAPLLLLLNRRWGGAVLLVLLALPTVVRANGWYGNFQTHARWDQCGVGVLLAYVSVFAPVWWRGLCRLAVPLALAGLAAVTCNLIWRTYPAWELADLDTLVWTGISASWVLLANSAEFWRSGMHFRVTRYIADRSYSLYLLHVEAVVLVEQVPGLSFFAALALSWALSLVFAEVLYRVIERPFLQAREWFVSSRQKNVNPSSSARNLRPESGGRLLFVYNADSGLFNMLSDIAHKIFSPATYACNLCAVTHSPLGMHKEWKSFLSELRQPMTFLHRDEFQHRYGPSAVALPAIFRQDEANRLDPWIDAEAINAARSIDDLKSIIRQRLASEPTTAGNLP